MSDSQTIDYFDIANSLLSSRRQWQQVPEVVPLTFKAIVRLLQSHQDSFQEHKTLINQQSLKIKEVELRMGGKLGKKEFEAEINTYIRSNSFLSKKEDDSISQYEKLVKESRYDKERQDQTTAEEIKTISEIICDNKIGSFQKKLQTKILAQRLQFQQKLMSMKQQLKYRFLLSEKDLRQMKETIADNKATTNFLRQSQNRSIASNSEQKIHSLEVSSKRITESINHIIEHIQNNYLTKDQLLKIIQNLKSNKEKSPAKSRVKEDGKSKSLKDSDSDMARVIQPFLLKQKSSIDREWQDFKQSIFKELGQTVKVDTVNNLIDRFQKEILEKISSISSYVHKLESKINNNQQLPSKQILTKSQKRAEKKVSPSKITEQIHSKLAKIQKTVTQQKSDSKKLQQEMLQQIQAFDKKLIKQLDRRQRKMCEVIEETCSKTLQGNSLLYQKDSLSQVRNGLLKVFQTNLFCRYVYHGTSQCKKDTNIIWQKEVLNNLVENFGWKQDYICINSRGLYRVEVGLFSQKLETQSHLLLNDQPVATLQKPVFINNPSKKAKGRYFHEFLLLPAKSKISVRVSQHFYGQAVLSIQQL